MRTLIRNLLMANDGLADMIGDRWFEWSAMIDQAQFPYGAIRLSSQQPGVTARGVTRQGRVEIWVYDERGTFTRIDEALRHIHAVMDNVVNAELIADGGRLVRLSLADWSQDSTELWDEQRRANARSSAYNCVGRGW
jgi:hypothetical protein